MTVKNNGKELGPLRTLFNEGAIGALSDAQLLEQFANGRGETRESAFAALVERHGPFVLRVCRSVLREEGAAEDAFQATFLALARKAGSLWARDSLAPWLHQAAYRAAAHDRSATNRRRSHERAAAALRPESVSPSHRGHDDDVEKILHEEIDRLPGRFRVAVVLCDLEGRTHEQAARHLGCAVGTVKSRLARGRKRLHGRLVRRGVAPALAMAATSGGVAARAAVPTGLAESTIASAATAGAAPPSIALIAEGVLRAMFLRKLKLAMSAAAVVAALGAGVVALAQSGIGRSKDETGKPQQVGPSPAWTYHILVSRNGEPPRKVAVVELTGDSPIRVDAPGALILIQPRRDGEPNPSGPNPSRSEIDRERRKIVLTSPKFTDVNITYPYICKICARRHVDVRAPEKGFLDEIRVKVGQAVKKGDLMFRIVPGARVVKPADVTAPFDGIRAPFDGIVGRLHEQQGSLVKEGDTLTTLSDNSGMWVYFNVPERRYLEFMASRNPPEDEKVELVLANGIRFPQPGRLSAIEANFDDDTGTIPFRADFPNPDRVLRHGQTGTILMHRMVRDALVIPQRATFEIHDRRYVDVVDRDNVVHRREIVVQHELDDLFVIKKGVGVGDRIVLEGVRQVRDGEKVEYEFRNPDEVIPRPTNRAE